METPVYTLYGSKGSGSAAIEAALAIADVPHAFVNAASWEPDSALAELARVNPLLQIPTLVVPGGEVMTESAAILIHLGLAHPASGLLPAEPAARDQAIRGLIYVAANCYSAIGIIDYPERWCADATDAVKEAIRRGTRERLHRNWEIFADAFPPRGTFLCGAQLGAIDLLAGMVSKWSGTRAHLRSARPAFSALLDRIDAHPCVAAVFGRHWPG